MSSSMSIDPQRLHAQTRFSSRREFLERAGSGFGLLALFAMMEEDLLLGASPGFTDPLAPKQPNFPAKAKSVIFLFMHGGPSHLDTFDPKPLLEKLDGQKLPPSLQIGRAHV